jgi:prevent-host-death family protein
MRRIPIEEAQGKLAELIHELKTHEEIEITEDGKPAARLVRLDPNQQWPCKAGSAKGTIHWMAPDFDAPLEEFKEYME